MQAVYALGGFCLINAGTVYLGTGRFPICDLNEAVCAADTTREVTER